MPRDPALRPYRIAVYVAFGCCCALLFAQLLRSVIGDLYGRRARTASQQSATACLEDLERLYRQILARAVQPAPFGLQSDALAQEWDRWSRRWEDEVERVSAGCRVEGNPPLAEALDGIEELRRRLSRSGEEAAEDARRVKEALAEARRQLGLR